MAAGRVVSSAELSDLTGGFNGFQLRISTWGIVTQGSCISRLAIASGPSIKRERLPQQRQPFSQKNITQIQLTLSFSYGRDTSARNRHRGYRVCAGVKVEFIGVTHQEFTGY